MASVAAEGDDTVYDIAADCEGLFAQVQAQLRASASVVANLFEEYQHGFIAWTAYLGVFANKAVCLDRRLRRHPELQDVVVRLLDLVHVNLQHISSLTIADSVGEVERPAGGGDLDGKPGASLPPDLDVAFGAIHDAIDRLNQIGILIRQSSTSGNTSSPEGGPFKNIMVACVRALYPRARAELQQHLSDYMSARHDDITARQARQQNYRRRRTTPNSGAENLISQDPSPRVSQPQQSPPAELPPSRQQGNSVSGGLGLGPGLGKVRPVRESEHSSIISALLRQGLNSLSPSGHHRGGASSIQVKEFGYPTVPQGREGAGVVTCEWCFRPLQAIQRAGADWKLHVDNDFKPYMCLSEGCSHSEQGFATFKDWFSHMYTLHDAAWYLNAYPPVAWVCVICHPAAQFNAEFRTPQDLDKHLSIEHQFITEDQRKAIVHQSLTNVRRGANDCPVCCLTVEIDNQSTANDELGASTSARPINSTKRGPDSELPQSTPKRSRTPPRDKVLARENSSGGELQFPDQRITTSQPSALHSKIMSRHVAGHLQNLMLVMIRLMDVEKYEDDQPSHGSQDGKSAAASGYISSQEILEEDEFLHFSKTPTESEVGQTKLDNELVLVPLRKNALDDLNHDVDVNTCLVDLESWRNDCAVTSLDSPPGNDDGDFKKSSWESIIESHVYENGRRYHSYHRGKYPFPNDEVEQACDEMKNLMSWILCNYAYFLAPVEDALNQGGVVLDLGTGAGQWAIEVGEQYSSAEIIGIDLSPIQPLLVPTNVSFFIDDFEEEWADPQNKYDFIHIRHTLFSVRDRKALYQRALKHLKPGGYIEFQELEYWPRCDDDTLSPEKSYPLRDYLGYLAQGMGMFADGSDLHAVRTLPDELRAAGFENVQSIRHKCPLGPWPAEKRLRTCGMYLSAAFLDGLSGVSTKPLLALGWTQAEIEVLLFDVREAIMDPTIHAYFAFHVVYGRKPSLGQASKAVLIPNK